MSKRNDQNAFSTSANLVKKLDISNDDIFDYFQSFYDLNKKVFKPIKWAVSGLFPVGLTILGGRPKVGKSFFCLQLITSVAVGGKFLGYYSCHKNADSLYISLEDGERRVQHRTDDLNMPCPENAYLLSMSSRIGFGLIDNIRVIKERYPAIKLIIIDTLVHILPPKKGNITDYEHYMHIFKKLQHLAWELEINLTLIHHTKKSTKESRAQGAIVFEELLGSVAFQGGFDNLMILKRASAAETGYLMISGRDYGDRNIALKFEDGLWAYDDVIYVPGGNQADQAIGKAIKEAPEQTLTQKQIVQITKLRQPHVSKRLKAGAKKSRFIEVEKGVWQLPSSLDTPK